MVSTLVTQTMQDRDNSQLSFVQTTLPWLVSGAALLGYLLTLNHWVTLSSLPVVAKVTGWDWSPELNAPLHYLLTYPFRWLPAGWQPIGLNLFAAVCAALTLALLARSVALLPHDRTREQRQRERSEFSLLTNRTAWLPPVFAALVCGLQLTFWENATAATGELLDLLLFAYVIRCLLEFRIDQRESWLARMALVYGLAATNNWAMIGFFPLFLAALIWIKGASFFDFHFVARMLVCGLAGLLLYLLLPFAARLTDSATGTFLELLRMQLGSQKNILLGFPKGRVLILALTSLLPLLVMGIRWPSSFGDTSVVGAVVSNLMSRVVHGMFLVACLGVAFDPNFSPRALGYGVPFLTFYYLGALSVGYFSGYFLLVFGEPSGSKSWHRPSPAVRAVNRVLWGAVCVAFVAVPAGLIYKNLPAIRENNSPVLSQYSALSAKTLPARGSVLLSDDAYQLLLLKAALSKSGASQNHVLLDTRSLAYPVYQRHLLKRFPQLFPPTWAEYVGRLTDPLDSFTQLQLIAHFLNSNQVFYLQPSFGYFFETLYIQPSGLLYQVHRYATNAIVPPPLTAAELKANEAFWAEAKEPLLSLAKKTAGKTFSASAKQINSSTSDAQMIGRWYSLSLNYWGVEMQKAGRLEEAGKHFALARDLNPENVSALVNLKFNEHLRGDKAKPFDLAKSDGKMLEKYKNNRVDEVLATNGPFDEPDLCFQVGQILTQGKLNRQAAIQFLRVVALEPDNIQARLWLGNVYLLAPLPDKTMEIVNEIRAQNATRPLQRENLIELIRLEAWAYYWKTNLDQAERLLLDGLKTYPQENSILETLARIYLRSRRFTNALETVEKQLQLAPDTVDALLNKGAIYVELQDYKQAIPPLNRVLELQPDYTAARFNRAIANLKSGQLDTAQKDYEALKKVLSQSPQAHAIYYGLGEIAYQKKDTRSAILNYKEFLKRAPEGTIEIKQVSERLKQLESGVSQR